METVIICQDISRAATTKPDSRNILNYIKHQQQMSGFSVSPSESKREPSFYTYHFHRRSAIIQGEIHHRGSGDNSHTLTAASIDQNAMLRQDTLHFR